MGREETKTLEMFCASHGVRTTNYELTRVAFLLWVVPPSAAARERLGQAAVDRRAWALDVSHAHTQGRRRDQGALRRRLASS